LRPERTLDFAREFAATTRALLVEGRSQCVFRHVDPERDTAIFVLALSPFFPVKGREHPALPDAVELRPTVDWFIDLWKKGRSERHDRKERP
jgi:hypothetical protein